MNFVNSTKKEERKKEENRILSRLKREATKNFLYPLRTRLFVYKIKTVCQRV